MMLTTKKCKHGSVLPNVFLILALICSSITSYTASATQLRSSRSALALVPPRSQIGRNNRKMMESPLYPYKLPEDGTNVSTDASVRQTRLFNDIQLRGGDDSKIVVTSPSKLKKVAVPTALSILIILVVANRKAIAAFNFKEELATRLDTLAGLGTPGLIMYIIGFMIWEITVGVTTPVETAAGMAFGLKNGIIANAIGKTSGAFLAFLLGRYVLKDLVEKKLEGNELMELVQDSIVKNPLRVSLIWRFSFLPEQIKNFGLAVLPVKAWQFLSAVLMHGFPFTLLWTYLGTEMGLIVRGIIASPSRTLKILMSGVYVFGFFISPTMVGLWVKGLRDEKLKKDSAELK